MALAGFFAPKRHVDIRVNIIFPLNLQVRKYLAELGACEHLVCVCFAVLAFAIWVAKFKVFPEVIVAKEAGAA